MGFSCRNLAQGLTTLVLASIKSGHAVKIWTSESEAGEEDLQVGRQHRPEKSPDQCLASKHVRYRSDSILS